MQLPELFRNLFGLTDESLIQRLSAQGEVRLLKKGHVLYREGETPSKLTFLIQGLLRGYFLDAGGRDITDCFAFRCGDVAVGCGTLDQPSLVNIEALSQAQVLKIPMGVVRELLQDPAVMQIYLDRLSQSLMRHWELKILMYHCSALQRYQWFLKTHAGLPKGISGKYIASYLGMNPVTLSRLRHREDGRAAEERP